MYAASLPANWLSGYVTCYVCGRQAAMQPPATPLWEPRQVRGEVRATPEVSLKVRRIRAAPPASPPASNSGDYVQCPQRLINDPAAVPRSAVQQNRSCTTGIKVAQSRKLIEERQRPSRVALRKTPVPHAIHNIHAGSGISPPSEEAHCSALASAAPVARTSSARASGILSAYSPLTRRFFGSNGARVETRQGTRRPMMSSS